ncbi:MAG: hypothetical protein ABIZ80_13915 [Bryobacteraceae bacterium]
MMAASHAAEVLAELTEYGHDLRELERSADSQKEWTPAPRMRVRMPELVCIQCGLRVETRRVGDGFSLAHREEQASHWSSGLVDSDLVAFGAERYVYVATLRATPFERRMDDGEPIACWPDASTEEALGCPGAPAAGYPGALLVSRERTQRFTGVKIARITRDRAWRDLIAAVEQDHEEDIYTRLEAAAYLTSVFGESAEALFLPYLENADEQICLEAILALADGGEEAGEMLTALQEDAGLPQWMRDAAAWALEQ